MSKPLRRARAHTRAHTHAHARTRTQAHARTNSHTRTHALTNTHKYTHTYTVPPPPPVLLPRALSFSLSLCLSGTLPIIEAAVLEVDEVDRPVPLQDVGRQQVVVCVEYGRVYIYIYIYIIHRMGSNAHCESRRGCRRAVPRV
jgi:hypothetical protein